LSLKFFESTISAYLSTPPGDIINGAGEPEIQIVLGHSGRDEITKAIVTIESHLLYQVNPDFVIKRGGNYLTDFLIWQSVYSELLLTDIN
jgi:undecaprenyl diphosphate synthase